MPQRGGALRQVLEVQRRVQREVLRVALAVATPERKEEEGGEKVEGEGEERGYQDGLRLNGQLVVRLSAPLRWCAVSEREMTMS